jgi:hypothetical protein
LRNEKNHYRLVKISAQNFSDTSSVLLPDNLYIPLKIINNNENIFVIFSNALLIYDKNLNEILFDYYNFNSITNNNTKLEITTISNDNIIIISSDNNSILLKMEDNPL